VTLLTQHYRRRGATVATAIVAALALVASATPSPAGADQLANDRAEASYLAARISSLGQTEDALSEQYDEDVVVLAKANSRVVSASRALTGAKAAQTKTVSLLQQDAVEAYVGGGAQMASNGTVPTGSVNDAMLRQELAQTFAAQQTDALDSYQLSADEETTDRQALVKARNADARQVARLDKDRAQVEAAAAQLVSLEQSVNGRIAQLLAQIQQAKLEAEQQAEAALLAEQRAQAAAQAQAEAEAQAEAQAQAARIAAAQQAAAAAATTTTTAPPPATTAAANSGSSDFVPSTPALPGVSSAASVAVAAAESRVGDPYVWGAAGPDEFDCSGLVMWAYAQAGVSLPHYSGSQYADTVAIPMSDLEPGDLVFPADPGVHVAMYIGDGEIVQAPYTGADVQIVALNPSFFVLASRVG
jgi:cell wall-associated NlpC family hydrolase